MFSVLTPYCWTTPQVNARNEADIVLLDDVVAVFRSGIDVHLYVVSLSFPFAFFFSINSAKEKSSLVFLFWW